MKELQKETEEKLQQAKAKRSGKFEQFGLTYYDRPAAFAYECLKWKKGEGLTSYQDEIISAIPEKKRVCVRGCHGLGKCVGQDEEIPLADGRLLKASDLVGCHFVLLSYEEDGSQLPSVAWAEDNGRKPVFRVTTRDGRSIVRTGNHPLLSARLRQHHPREPVSITWKPIEQLKPGDLVLVPERLQVKTKRTADDSLIKLAGYLLGDGGTTKEVTFTQKDGKTKDEFCHIVELLGSAVTYVDSLTIRVTGPEKTVFGRGANPVMNLVREWDLIGKGARTKRFPSWVWELPDNQLALLLNRLFSCDGYAYTYLKTSKTTGRQQLQSRIGITLASEGMIRDVELALLRLGVNGSIRKRQVTYEGQKSYHERKKFLAWEWSTWKSSEILKFSDRVGIFGKEEDLQRAVGACSQVNRSKCFKYFHKNCPDGYRWEPIKEVVGLGEQPTVAICVVPTHTYVTTFVEHNTMLASSVILWFCLTREALSKDWKGVVTASVGTQLRQYLWPEVKKWCREIRWDKIGREPFNNRSELLTEALQLTYGRAFCVAPEESAKLEGAHADELLYVFDESKAIPDNIFDAAEGAFSGAGEDTGRVAYALAMSTPGAPIGRFHAIQTDRTKYAAWWPRWVTVEEVLAAGRVSLEYIEQKKIQWGEESSIFQQKVLGQFASADDNALIPLAWVEAAMLRGEADELIRQTARQEV